MGGSGCTVHFSGELVHRETQLGINRMLSSEETKLLYTFVLLIVVILLIFLLAYSHFF